MPRITTSALTAKSVESAKAKSERFDMFDANVRGLALRISPAGTKSWIVLKRANGRPVRVTLGRYPDLTLAEARDRAKDAIKDLSSGKRAGRERGQTAADHLHHWLEADQKKNRSYRDVRAAVEGRIIPAIGKRKLDEIERRDVVALVDQIAEEAPIQANRVLSYLRRFFNWCIEQDIIQRNPTAGIRRRAKETARDRVLSLSELRHIFTAAEAFGYPFAQLIRILILTGQRLNEVAQAEWQEFDLEACRWEIPAARAKNGRSHIVHLSVPVVEILQSLPRTEGARYLFSTTGSTPVSGFSKMKKRLDTATALASWTFHDLRRSFATHATERLGAKPQVVDRILNHVSGYVTGVAAVYQRGQYLEERRETLDRWAALVGGTAD